MKVSPYLLLRNSDRRDVTKLLEEHLNKWSKVWLSDTVPNPASELTIIRDRIEFNDKIKTLRQHRIVDAGSSRLACVQTSSQRKFAEMLLGGTGTNSASYLTDIETALVGAALEDLGRRILGAETIDNSHAETPSADEKFVDLLRPGGAAVCCEFTLLEFSLSILLSPEALASIWSRPTATPLDATTTSIHEALTGLAQSKVKITAVLSPAEMTVGDLFSLNVGDVIRLKTRVDANIAAHVDESPVTLQANLGRVSDFRALQIVGIASE